MRLLAREDASVRSIVRKLLRTWRWTDEHLFSFSCGGTSHAAGANRYDTGTPPLRNFPSLFIPGQSFNITYDFGDDWNWKGQVLRVLQSTRGSSPYCVRVLKSVNAGPAPFQYQRERAKAEERAARQSVMSNADLYDHWSDMESASSVNYRPGQREGQMLGPGFDSEEEEEDDDDDEEEDDGDGDDDGDDDDGDDDDNEDDEVISDDRFDGEGEEEGGADEVEADRPGEMETDGVLQEYAEDLATVFAYNIERAVTDKSMARGAAMIALDAFQAALEGARVRQVHPNTGASAAAAAAPHPGWMIPRGSAAAAAAPASAPARVGPAAPWPGARAPPSLSTRGVAAAAAAVAAPQPRLAGGKRKA